MSYFDIAEIVAEEERLPCTFLTDAELIGYLDSTSDREDIEADTRVELPLWLADALSKRNMVSVDLPRGFGSRTRQALLADAMSVPLRERSAHCFHLCVRAAEISSRPEALDLPRVARVALSARAATSLDRATNSVGTDVAALRAQLTDIELALFERGYDVARDRLEWRRRLIPSMRVSGLERGIAAKRARAAALASDAAAARAEMASDAAADEERFRLQAESASSSSSSASGYAHGPSDGELASTWSTSSSSAAAATAGGRAPTRDADDAMLHDSAAKRRRPA
ncbi:hypothetical protein FNF27_03299 [Cafeteria roenbergensis]|uniref:DNA replication complex GINS protein PSF3 N-terminal domain-containing protein n=1 Tax=Cafeteria roenbergensis TaxID=33653 RepID=A0A5A8CH61_CAFRO|nr:hypothetical protein FNF29_04230 [Cafeteria roenbergensis]KAA0175291.1 hypothetical protein FNF27_03299 [Cafeteria roenbergensis]|eukprot:KAA0151824.1 hypothetical protein FNF29_04230 [Cafeteria roenbergensis]